MGHEHGDKQRKRERRRGHQKQPEMERRRKRPAWLIGSTLCAICSFLSTRSYKLIPFNSHGCRHGAKAQRNRQRPKKKEAQREKKRSRHETTRMRKRLTGGEREKLHSAQQKKDNTFSLLFSSLSPLSLFRTLYTSSIQHPTTRTTEMKIKMQRQGGVKREKTDE